jgi:hypothetical protein
MLILEHTYLKPIILELYVSASTIEKVYPEGKGNTITIQKCKQAATQSGFDNNQGQECDMLLITGNI